MSFCKSRTFALLLSLLLPVRWRSSWKLLHAHRVKSCLASHPQPKPAGSVSPILDLLRLSLPSLLGEQQGAAAMVTLQLASGQLGQAAADAEMKDAQAMPQLGAGVALAAIAAAANNGSTAVSQLDAAEGYAARVAAARAMRPCFRSDSLRLNSTSARASSISERARS